MGARGKAGREAGSPRRRDNTRDALGRLVQVVEDPGGGESGTISYSYDDNGNVHTRTDAAGVVTTYDYDGLNRLKSKTYSDGKTAAVWMTANDLLRAVLSEPARTAEFSQTGRFGKTLDI